MLIKLFSLIPSRAYNLAGAGLWALFAFGPSALRWPLFGILLPLALLNVALFVYCRSNQTRVQLVKVLELPWCPAFIRDAVRDVATLIMPEPHNQHPIVSEALRASGCRTVLDLCSGAGGPMPLIHQHLYPGDLSRTILTDLDPDIPSWRRIAEATPGVEFIEKPVDACAVRATYQGEECVRTMFHCLHQFTPNHVARILEDTVRSGDAIVVFDMPWRDDVRLWEILTLMPTLLVGFVPTSIYVMLRRSMLSLVFLPITVPLATLAWVFDGIVAQFRAYTPTELRAMFERIGADHYQLHFGTEGLVRRGYFSAVPRAAVVETLAE